MRSTLLLLIQLTRISREDGVNLSLSADLAFPRLDSPCDLRFPQVRVLVKFQLLRYDVYDSKGRVRTPRILPCALNPPSLARL